MVFGIISLRYDLICILFIQLNENGMSKPKDE